jgi:site-specific DNA-methyltransferase (adenine-specific)|tara:strand:- start:136 stop:957 length:822 start_codon:yes stop_codon:yes gene_type:complete
MNNYNIEHKEGLEFLKDVENNSIDLILTDPPYIISKNSGMEEHYKKVKQHDLNKSFEKTPEQWEIYKQKNKIKDDKNKTNYLKYGSIYGKKYATKTDFGNWDNNFTEEILDNFIEQYYKKLRIGGTLIIWFDIWKITTLKYLLEKHKFKQIRFIEWIKTNPQPINQRVNYLTNCREIALLGVKRGKPTFNSKYDNGKYEYPMASGKNKFHPTQKNLKLFEELIEKHSNEGDLVMDTFLGGGTTATACKNKNRRFTGCEVNKEYYEQIIKDFST